MHRKFSARERRQMEKVRAAALTSYFRMTKLSGGEGASTPVGAIVIGWGRAPVVGEPYRVSGLIASSSGALDWYCTTRVVRMRKYRHCYVITTLNSRWKVVQISYGQALEDREAMGRGSPGRGLAYLLSAEGGCVGVTQARALVRNIRKKIRTGEIIACRTKAGWRVPVWQFRPKGGLLKGLPEVLAKIRAVLPHTDGLFPFAFFLQPNPVTGGRKPLEALREGDLKIVLTAVDGFRG